MSIERDWYTTEEAARELGLAPSTIRGAAMRGVLKVKVEVIAPRVRAITRDELERYRAEHLGKRWETRRAGLKDESRATYYREYRARKKAREAGKADMAGGAEVDICPAQDTGVFTGTAAG